MPKTILSRLPRDGPSCSLRSLLPALGQGQTAQPTRPRSKVKESRRGHQSGTSVRVDPDRVKLKRREEIVVWVTNGQALKIAFKKANPFTDLVCKGRFCAALTPPDVLGIFDYKVTVDRVVLDPNVEVVP